MTQDVGKKLWKEDSMRKELNLQKNYRPCTNLGTEKNTRVQSTIENQITDPNSMPLSVAISSATTD